MKSAAGIRRWHSVHKWTSLVSTLFMLIACVTGLPLIFSDEIDALGRNLNSAPSAIASNVSKAATLDEMAATARQERPDKHLQLLFRDDADPGITSFAMGDTLDGPIGSAEYLRIDDASGKAVDSFRANDGVMGFLFEVHARLMAGVGGTLFLGVMAMALTVSIISGVVLYSPFMRRRSFAVIRLNKSKRVRWFDLHNALGIVLTAWLLMVSITGIINTWAAPITNYWMLNDMQRIVEQDETPIPAEPAKLSSIDDAMKAASSVIDAGEMLFIAMPGSELSSERHYVVVFVGETPVTSRLYYGAVINAHSGELIAAPELPAYLAIALLSQPLHFGDYGGLALKLVWLVFGVGSVILLWSGLVLWWRKRSDEPVIVTAGADAPA
ncbi:MAG: PepSY-associated TM helix domain-containing protein [Pseudomonadota bacterium]